jgi:hypothetical protein
MENFKSSLKQELFSEIIELYNNGELSKEAFEFLSKLIISCYIQIEIDSYIDILVQQFEKESISLNRKKIASIVGNL